MLRVLIIDDEKNAVATVQNYISKYTEDVSVVGVAHSKAEAVSLMNATSFDLALLDINLGDGSGFDVLEETNNDGFALIFTTAYDEHAIKAFKYSALDYLLKPLNPEEFLAAIERSKAHLETIHKSQIDYATSINTSKTVNKLVVNSSQEIHFLEISDIQRLESYRNYTDIHMRSGQKITATKTLKYFDTILAEQGFFRIHQKHLVNMNYIVKFLKEDGGYVLLDDGSKLEVSRRKKDELLQTLIKS